MRSTLPNGLDHPPSMNSVRYQLTVPTAFDERAGYMKDRSNVSMLLTEDAVQRRWYITVPEVEAHTGFSQELIRKSIYRGELKATRMHRRWLMTVDDVRAWIEEHGEPNVA